MRLEVVTTCVHYGDFLRVTAQQNRGLFDRWTIATVESDTETREVARRYNLDTLITDDFYHNGEPFAKGRVVEQLLRQCSAGSWRLHLDADIVLPAHFRQALEVANLDEQTIYGMDRVMVQGWDNWQKLLSSGYLHQQWQWHCSVGFPPGYPVGTRWVSPADGWVCIGFAQLLHSSADEYHGIRFRKYPHFHGDGCRTDVQFGLLWPRRKRALLPEVIAVHLESEASPLGANWKGRTTARFGPPATPTSLPTNFS